MPDNGPRCTDTRYEPCGRRIGAPWYVVWTKPNLERQAEHSLRLDGFPTFFPYHEVDVEKRDGARRQPRTRLEPLFRRYGFAQPNDIDQWVKMLYARGVAGVLRNPLGAPKVVPAHFIDALLKRCAANGVIYLPDAEPISEGQKTKVIDGAFTEIEGICSRAADERVWVLLTFLGCQREVEFKREQVEAA